MKKYLNYITTLPDFIEMQRISFCWFLLQGLTDELSNFSSIFDFSGNIEYVFFIQEYKLVKPIYNLLSAKRYTKNYVAQLVLPIEMRNKKTNIVMRQGRLPIANLPLMTTSATFIINGCERIIVSQVIRSPGIYFEKNKKQKKRKLNKLTTSNDFHKLRPFTQMALGLLKNPDSSILLPIVNESKNYSESPNSKEKTNENLNFLKFFKIYRITVSTFEAKIQKQKFNLFLQWLRLSNNFSSFKNQSRFLDTHCLLKKFNTLLRFLIKYKILQILINNEAQENISEVLFYRSFQNKEFKAIQDSQILKIKRILSKKSPKFKKILQIYQEQILSKYIPQYNQIYKLYQVEIEAKYLHIWDKKVRKYDFLIQNFKKKLQLNIKISSFLIFEETIKALEQIENLKFLKIRTNADFQKIKKFNDIFYGNKNFKPGINFPLIKNYRRSDIIKNKDYFEKKRFL